MRALIEDSLRLDLAHPEIRRVVGGAGAGRGVVRWCDGDHTAASVAYVWRPLARRLELQFSIAGANFTQFVQVAVSPSRFGGSRLWFECPDTGALIRALYLPPGRRHWAGRVAHDLGYASQRTRPPPFKQLIYTMQRDEAASRRNHIRRLRRRERLRERRRV